MRRKGVGRREGKGETREVERRTRKGERQSEEGMGRKVVRTLRTAPDRSGP